MRATYDSYKVSDCELGGEIPLRKWNNIDNSRTSTLGLNRFKEDRRLCGNQQWTETAADYEELICPSQPQLINPEGFL